MMSETINKKVQQLQSELRLITGYKPCGAENCTKRLKELAEYNVWRLFIPWAAPPSEREMTTERDKDTLSWLFGTDGLIPKLSKVMPVECIVMFADIYAERNGISMDNANQYWKAIETELTGVPGVEFVRTSQFDVATMDRLKAEESYAFERLLQKYGTIPKTAVSKILQAAIKYGQSDNDQEIYESAAEYTMLRSAEGRYVDENLGALWVSLNWPERDVMCQNVPRLYIPQGLRAPWLKD